MAKTEQTKILVVDDDESYATVTAASLESQGYSVRTAYTGQRALSEVSAETPEIVLLDLVLPDAEGTEILRKIRQIDRNVAVITVTGYGDEHRAVDVMKAGSCDYLAKPFKLEDLVHCIEKALMWREMQRIEEMSEGYMAIEKGAVAYANRFLIDLLGYSREQITGMPVSRLFSKTDPGGLQPCVDGGERRDRTQELEALHRDGSTRTLEARISKETFQGREVISALLRDISATRHLEAALRETQTLYENLILNASDAITLINPQGTFALVNPKFCELSGYSEEETKKLHFSRLIHPEDLNLFAERHSRTLAGENLPGDYQFRIIRKTGEIVFVDFNANAVKREGEIIGIQAIARDITERKHAERELQARMEELEKWHKLTVDRELRMIELKKKIQTLESQVSHLKKLKKS